MIFKRFFALWCFVCVVFAFCFVSCGGGSGSSAIENWTGDKEYVSEKNAVASDAQNQSKGLEKGWWESTTFYHIWVRSFASSNDTGCGNLKGITQNLDYIYDLGFRGIWLSPIFECDFKGINVNMHGYDVKDYYKINSLFGTEDDLVELINACHDKDIKIIFDFVPNHSGAGNQWFQDSAANKNGKRDWYVWNSTALKWNTGMSLSGWTQKGGGYYWHAFDRSQPDLNFRNYEVREEMKNVVRYWLNKGFDGLRIDAVRYLIENNSSQVDTAESIDFFKELREELDKYESPKFMTFEAWITNDRNTLNRYFGTESEPAANMLLDFDQGSGIVSAINGSSPSALRNTMYTAKDVGNVGGGCYYGTFLANHDEYQPRLGSLFDGDDAEKAKIHLATALSLLRPTTPFVYYGQEIAMANGSGTGDIRLRWPFDWFLADSQKKDSISTYSLNKMLIHLRNELPNLFSSRGTVTFLESAQKYDGAKVDKVSAYTISDGNDVLLCVSNLSKYQWAEYAFAVGDAPIDNEDDYTLIMASEEEDTLSVESERIVLKRLHPYEVRLYYSGSTLEKLPPLFLEYYLSYGVGGEGEIFEGEEYLGEDVNASEAFYLRGDMNNWDKNTPMKYNCSETTWKVKVSLAKNTYSFKLDKGGDWKTAYGYNSSKMSSAIVQLNMETRIYIAEGSGTTNLSFTAPSAGDYIFSFNEKTGILKITKAEK